MTVGTITARTTPAPSFLLLHGAATTGAIWAGVRRALGDRLAFAPDRPSSGDLDSELAAVRDAVALAAATTPATARPVGAPAPPWLASGAAVTSTREESRAVVFGGVSGGATLGLAALATGVPLAAAVLHEPAVGSLLPGLLAPMAAAYASGGVAAFGSALYGPSWRPTDGPIDPDAVARDLSMFLRFEPAAPGPTPGPVVVTVGERSPEIRHRAAAALHRELGVEVRVLAGCGHAAHLEAPAQFADLLAEVATTLG
ncbi:MULTISPECIES: alpha/beta fold hydrolase [unclassified Frankia]|uniref:alpha/beta fold hydrolase n=1 Tax=unclassified Frankia TaxID=2632575 RepID=UPI0027DBDA23|nr:MULTISPECIES: alpha/beta fold hydrolase [unclassified Frankia]